MTERFIVDDDGIVTDMLDLSMYVDEEDCCDKLNELHEENEQLKQRINSRLYFYRELYDSMHDDIVKRVVEDLEDILKGDV